jgi:transmembrane sensor
VRSAHPWRLGLKLGAAAVALLILGLGLMFRFGDAGASRYSTGIGGFERVPLADGSVIELNTASEVSVRLGGARREVKLLRGEANFKVAPDDARPFEVTAGRTIVKAVGTEFSVRVYAPRQVGVFVVDGRVAVLEARPERSMLGLIEKRDDAGVQEIRAGAGQRVMDVSGKLGVSESSPAEAAVSQAWRRGRREFSGQALAEVVSEVNRYNYVQLVIADPSIAQLRVGGKWKPAEIESLLTGLEKTMGIQASRVADPAGGATVVYLRRAGH